MFPVSCQTELVSILILFSKISKLLTLQYFIFILKIELLIINISRIVSKQKIKK